MVGRFTVVMRKVASQAGVLKVQSGNLAVLRLRIHQYSLGKIAADVADRLGNLLNIVTAPGGEYVKIIVCQEALQDEFRLQMGGSRIPAEVLSLDTAHHYHGRTGTVHVPNLIVVWHDLPFASFIGRSIPFA